MTPQKLYSDIRKQNRTALSKSITLVESSLESDQKLAADLMDIVIKNNSCSSFRIGISGIPGSGKSSLINVLGEYSISKGHKVAVLSVDPSSNKSRGSILGDKTRMDILSANMNAYVRPSPSKGYLGGVSFATRDAILLCELFGYDIIFVETVGIGQSETSIKNITDLLLLVVLTGGGDDLQGIKRGILEEVHHVVINKIDTIATYEVQKTKQLYRNAFHLLSNGEKKIPINLCSSTNKIGIKEIWDEIISYKKLVTTSSQLHQNRKAQSIENLHEQLKYYMIQTFYRMENTKKTIHQLEKDILSNKISIRKSVIELLKSYNSRFQKL